MISNQKFSLNFYCHCRGTSLLRRATQHAMHFVEQAVDDFRSDDCSSYVGACSWLAGNHERIFSSIGSPRTCLANDEAQDEGDDDSADERQEGISGIHAV